MKKVLLFLFILTTLIYFIFSLKHETFEVCSKNDASVKTVSVYHIDLDDKLTYDYFDNQVIRLLNDYLDREQQLAITKYEKLDYKNNLENTYNHYSNPNPVPTTSPNIDSDNVAVPIYTNLTYISKDKLDEFIENDMKIFNYLLREEPESSVLNHFIERILPQKLDSSITILVVPYVKDNFVKLKINDKLVVVIGFFDKDGNKNIQYFSNSLPKYWIRNYEKNMASLNKLTDVADPSKLDLRTMFNDEEIKQITKPLDIGDRKILTKTEVLEILRTRYQDTENSVEIVKFIEKIQNDIRDNLSYDIELITDEDITLLKINYSIEGLNFILMTSSQLSDYNSFTNKKKQMLNEFINNIINQYRLNISSILNKDFESLDKHEIAMLKLYLYVIKVYLEIFYKEKKQYDKLYTKLMIFYETPIKNMEIYNRNLLIAKAEKNKYNEEYKKLEKFIIKLADSIILPTSIESEDEEIQNKCSIQTDSINYDLCEESKMYENLDFNRVNEDEQKKLFENLGLNLNILEPSQPVSKCESKYLSSFDESYL